MLLPFQLPFLPVPVTVPGQFQDSVPGTWNRLVPVTVITVPVTVPGTVPGPFLVRSWPRS